MFKTILLAYDGSREYRAALRQGAELAQFCGADVYLLAVVTSASSMSRTIRYRPFGCFLTCDAVARLSSCPYLPWMTDVNPSRAYPSTRFHTSRTDPQVVSTSTQPI